MITKNEILNFLKIHKPELKQKFNIEKIGLFGSFARDEANEKSDIDIFVDMKADLFMMVKLKTYINTYLKMSVDIVRNHKHIKPFLLKMIQKDIIYV